MEFDGWTALNGLNLLAVVVTSQKGTSILLDLIDISSDTHSAEFIKDKIFETLTRSGLSNKLFNSVVSDEAGNCRLARSKVVDEISHLLEFRCMAHLFNLIGGSISKSSSVRPILDQLAIFVNAVSRNKFIISKLKEEKLSRPIHSVLTRWYTISGSISSVLALREAFANLPKTDKYSYSKWGPHTESPDFWSSLQKLGVIFDRISKNIAKSESCDSVLSDSFRDLLELIRDSTDSGRDLCGIRI